MELCWTGRYLWVLPYTLEGLGDIAIARDRPEQGARLFGAAEAQRAEAGAAVRITTHPEYRSAVAAARARLGEPAFAAAWAQGRALPLAAAVAEALALAQELGQPVPSGASGAGLSPRERQVLGLIAEGHSDREIAAALAITYRTATTYVTAILNKLGVASRTAAIAQARRQGLL